MYLMAAAGLLAEISMKVLEGVLFFSVHDEKNSEIKCYIKKCYEEKRNCECLVVYRLSSSSRCFVATNISTSTCESVGMCKFMCPPEKAAGLERINWSNTE